MTFGVKNELIEFFNSIFLFHSQRICLFEKMLILFFRFKLQIVQLKTFFSNFVLFHDFNHCTWSFGNLSSKNRLLDRFTSSGINIWTGSWTGSFQRQISDRKAKQAFKKENRASDRFLDRTGGSLS